MLLTQVTTHCGKENTLITQALWPMNVKMSLIPKDLKHCRGSQIKWGYKGDKQ